jgi:replicative DNA helicase
MRGSDGIAYDADCCIILNEDENGVGLPEDVVRINVNIGKNRNGKTGESVVYFDRRFQRFSDEAPEK